MIVTDVVILQRIFDEGDLKKALTEFFEAQTAIETTTAAELMGTDHPDPEAARKHACMAKAYEEAMNRLRAYVRQV